MGTSPQFIKKYYDKRAVCQVLGILMEYPEKIKDDNTNLTNKDFITNTHEAVFIAIHNLALQDVNKITVGDIEAYINNTNPVSYKKIFENDRGLEWLNKMVEDANPDNYLHYYNKVKKMSLLRSYLQHGVDITDILNVDEIDVGIRQVQQDEFESMTIEDIIRKCDKKTALAKKGYETKDEDESRKAGDNAKLLYKQMKESPSFGMGMESDYLNTIARGMVKGEFFLETRDSGMGKTRVILKRLLMLTAPRLWDYSERTFVDNPNGSHSALYIGTEMDSYTELEPIMWSIVSGIATTKIKDNELTEEEEKRIKEAISILEDTNLFLVKKPNFDVDYLWKTVEEYKRDYNIYGVGLDYIELTSALIGEYTSNTKGMGVREDQILLNLSKNLKDIAEKFDVWMGAFTQTTDEARRDNVRDQRAVKGARSLPNKADVGVVVFEPTKKELDKIQPIVTKRKGIVDHKNPNVCYSFYKNRDGIHREVKIWAYQDLGTMEVQDMFCTDKDYKPININPTKIQRE